jgi:hypothetical protein
LADTILKDPLGRAMMLHDRTWHGHILKRHSELRLHRNLTEKAVQDPLEIRFSIYDSNCRTCYGVGPRSGIMIAVVIDVANSFVKTAFLTDRMKGAVEWSRPTP